MAGVRIGEMPLASGDGVTRLAASRSAWDPNEFRIALRREPSRQTPIPRPGDRVLFRMEAFGPLTPAEVLEVQDPYLSLDDHYLWHVVTDDAGAAVRDELGAYVLAPAPDPWPILTLATDWGRLTTREGRVRGSQGWWPLDWEHRWYPTPGGTGWARAIDTLAPTGTLAGTTAGTTAETKP